MELLLNIGAATEKCLTYVGGLAQLLGRAMAELHRAGQSFTMTRENSLSLAGWKQLYERTGDSAEAVEATTRNSCCFSPCGQYSSQAMGTFQRSPQSRTRSR